MKLEDIVAELAGLPPEQFDRVTADARQATRGMLWIPNPGPQTDAYFSDADELLFGGEAGGGKSDLGIGLSLTQHQRSLVLRRTNKEADKLFDRYAEIMGNSDGKNKNGWRVDGRIIDIGGVQLEKDKQKRKGIPHDLKFFDELVDFTRSMYEFIIGWTRTTTPGQRTRIVATTNPPTSPDGMWVVERWGPWLDPKHPRPAKDGELRWYTTIDGKDTEVDGPGPHMVDGKPVRAMSRTFIRSKLADNPDLTRTDDYQARLNALPKELREAYAEGRFDAALKDQPFQAVPTEWVRQAQERWQERPPHAIPMCGMGADASGGGEDPFVLAIRYDGWFAPLVQIPGKDIPADAIGRFCAGQILSHRKNHCPVVVDMGGGYGGSIYEVLKENGVEAIAHKGADAAVRRTKDGQLRYFNMRTQVIWLFREALDPTQPGGSPIMLPPSQRLLADLCAPRFWLKQGAIQVEPKEDVCARLGRSTDEGDAVVMAWSAGPTYLTDGMIWDQQVQGGGLHGQRPKVVMGRQHARRR